MFQSYRFITNKIIDKAIIFIDEFDATKETILKSIVQDDFRNRIDYIKLMNTVYSALTTRSISSEMLQMPHSFYVNKKTNYLESKEAMARLRSRAEAIYQKYSLNYNYKETFIQSESEAITKIENKLEEVGESKQL